mmetsp:Transcript_9189/g.23596  ORF Transcript_9189/g.23596 Transcript_9189/m.23596 type:complete len:314 (-) Transcript_9189:217-1158(-)
MQHRRRLLKGLLPCAAICGSLWLALAPGCSFIPPPAWTQAQTAAFTRTKLPHELLSEEARGGLQLASLTGALVSTFGASGSVSAALAEGAEMTPDTFRPVCPASDSVYNVGKGFADALLGKEGMEYRPLAIEALLRIRLEICVLESFVYEAIIPFVQKKGVGWVLPFHETIDTVIAGTVFAVALNFILFGTTKIVAVISIYHDFLIGAPLRVIGYAIFPEKRVRGPPPLIQINWPGRAPDIEPEEEEEEREPPPLPLAVFGGVCKGYGIFAEVVKNVCEGFDTFVGRYLVVTSVTYIAFKWAHFRLFPDFPPF